MHDDKRFFDEKPGIDSAGDYSEKLHADSLDAIDEKAAAATTAAIRNERLESCGLLPNCSIDEYQPAKGQSGDGVLFLQETLNDTLTRSFNNSASGISKDMLNSAVMEAQEHGESRKADALGFALRNYDNLLSLSSDDSELFKNHENISSSDIKQLQNYDSYLSTGNWLAKNPLVSGLSTERLALAGAALGALVEAGSFFTPLGVGMTTTGIMAGMPAGMIMNSIQDKADIPGAPGMFQPAAMAPFTGVIAGGIKGALWGPTTGYVLGSALSGKIATNWWNLVHKQKFELMYERMRKL